MLTTSTVGFHAHTGHGAMSRELDATTDTVDYKALFECSPGLYLALRPDARFTVVAATEAYCRTTMKAHDNVVGRGIFEAFPDANPENDAPTGAANLRASLEQVIRTGEPHQMDVQRYDTQRPDGSWQLRYWAPLNTPIFDDNGMLRYILHDVDEVTQHLREREAAEAAVGAARRARRLLERSSDAVVTLDERWRFTWFNPSGRELLRSVGATPENLIGTSVWEVFPDLLGTSFDYGLRDASTRGRVKRVEVSYPTITGAILIAEGDAVPIDDGVAVLLRDVTAYRRLIAAERDARATAESERLAAERSRLEAHEANQAKSAFLATMSHEIRTPINAQIGYAQLIELGVAGPVTEQQREYLSRIASTSEHLRGLVDDILDLSKIDAGRMQVAREPAMTGSLVATALDLVRPQANARGVRLLDQRFGDAGESFVGDEHRVRQVLVNLLSNAVKFTTSGGHVSITSACSPETPMHAELHGEGPWTCIRVTDTGIGIAPEEQRRIFEPFHQVERGNTREHGGTGLGLAISRKLARLMGGDLTFESTPGEGSTFVVWLPAAGADPERGDGAIESAAMRGARARLEHEEREHAVGEVGALLREHIEEVIVNFGARLRAEQALPQVGRLRRTELEDHQLSFLADLAQTLLVLDEAEQTGESELLRDGSTIQRVIAELHGAMRQRRGWNEQDLAREYAILSEEIAQTTRRCIPEGNGDISHALDMVDRLLDRAKATGIAALRRSAETVETP